MSDIVKCACGAETDGGEWTHHMQKPESSFLAYRDRSVVCVGCGDVIIQAVATQKPVYPEFIILNIELGPPCSA